jgi:hypothetical protein
MTTGLRLLQAGLVQTRARLERWQREDALRAAKLLDAAARSAEPGMRDAYLTSLRRLRQAIREADLAAVMESGGGAESLIDLIPWDSVAAGPMRAAWTAILLDLVARASSIAADALPSTVAAGLTQGGERAADWARSHAANMVTAITDGQRVAIRDTVARVFTGADEDRLTPAQAAQVIRSTVGLTPKLNQAVLNLRDELVEREQSQPKVDAGVRKYGDKLRAYRAQAIATTETLDASNVAQQSKWQEAVAQGLLGPHEVSRVWNVTEDDRLDLVVCAPMDGQRVGLNEFFMTGDGRQILTPTAHPFCRCFLTIEI